MKRLQFIILDERAIKNYNIFEKHIVISITSPGYKHPELSPSDSRIALLQLKFHDIDKPLVIKGKEYPVFTQEQAQAILNFFSYYKAKVNTIVVQCEVGVSRSPAVGAALAKINGQSDEKFFKYYVPNMYVYKKILEEAYKCI